MHVVKHIVLPPTADGYYRFEELPIEIAASLNPCDVAPDKEAIQAISLYAECEWYDKRMEDDARRDSGEKGYLHVVDSNRNELTSKDDASLKGGWVHIDDLNLWGATLRPNSVFSAQQYPHEEVRIHYPNVAIQMQRLIESGRFKGNMLDFGNGLYTAEYANKFETLPHFVLNSCPTEVPPELAKLQPNDEVFLRNNGIDWLTTAAIAINNFEKVMSRQIRGFFSIHEAAAIFAETVECHPNLSHFE